MRDSLKNIEYLIMLMVVIFGSCQPAEEDGHAHAPDGSHVTNGEEIPTVVTTIWTDKTELFVEYPALVVGNTSRFAAHFTVLDGHQPVREGSVTVSLVKGEKGVRHSVEAPSSPGIFKPSLQPKEAGVYQLIFNIKTPAITERIVLNDIQVYSSIEEAISKIGSEEEGNSISFLKEQAWKIEFQTATVLEKEIYETIHTSGAWKVAPSDYQTLAATSSGRVDFKMKNLTEGTPVKEGQVIMTVSSAGLTSNNLSAEIQKAKAGLDQVRSDYDRKKQLFDSKIVAKSKFEQVERNYQIAKANYETLSAGYTSGGKQIIVPFDGYIKSIKVSNGGFVDQGAPLVTVTSLNSSLLEAQISPSYAPNLKSLHDIWYQPKTGVWSSLNKNGGKILSVGKEVEADNPLLSIFAQINEGVEMPEGSFTEIQLAFGSPIKTMVIPETALLEDYGNYSVIVQLRGESFERRDIIIGKRNGSEVEILKGLSLGEVVVTKGAYQVKMASMSGAVPAHGHDH
ncbi:MAG: cobalt-zinc-cadmium efflux system membrane fusion protein [Cyclobacteriaceae bacterium]|jgi:cobalt-zinc-cadmium efflux system membrane fusion protein